MLSLSWLFGRIYCLDSLWILEFRHIQVIYQILLDHDDHKALEVTTLQWRIQLPQHHTYLSTEPCEEESIQVSSERKEEENLPLRFLYGLNWAFDGRIDKVQYSCWEHDKLSILLVQSVKQAPHTSLQSCHYRMTLTRLREKFHLFLSPLHIAPWWQDLDK